MLRKTVMRQAMRRTGAALFVAGAVLGMQAAQAAEGTNGIRIGPGRLHPALGLETRYDSLAVVTVAGEQDDLVLHLRPALHYASATRALELGMDVEGDWNVHTRARGLSFFGGDGELRAALNPEGAVGFNLSDDFHHGDRVAAVGLGAGVRSIRNQLHASVPMRLSGGLVEIVPGYTYGFEKFIGFYVSTPGVTDPADLDYATHRPALNLRWSVLPKTALVASVEGQLRTYDNPDRNPEVNALYGRVGIDSAITPTVDLLAAAGVSRGEADGAEDYLGMIGQLEATWRPGTTVQLRGGYLRTYEPVPQFAWYGDQRFYAVATGRFARQFEVDLVGTLDLVDYAIVAEGPAADAGERGDAVWALGLTGRYAVTRWVGLAAGWSTNLRRSDSAAPGFGAAYDYTRHELFGRVTLTY